MIDYRELSYLEKDLGVSVKMLYTLSNQRHRHYRNVKIPKGNGEFRQLCVPDDFLKAVQTKIAQKLLAYEPISLYAKAYRPGGSTLKNAQLDVSEDVYLRQLLGRVNYVLSVDPANQEMHEYKKWLQKTVGSGRKKGQFL